MKKIFFFTLVLIIVSCNNIEDPEGISNSLITQVTYEHNDTDLQSTGILNLKSNSNFYLELNTKDEYIEGSGTYKDLNSQIILTFTTLKHDNLDRLEGGTFSLETPYENTILLLNYPFENAKEGRIFRLKE